MKLYAAPRTRAVRIAWLLEELALPYELVPVEFVPTTSQFFIQNTPSGKIPTLEDGEVILSESGAIVEYILERYGNGSLTPAIHTPLRAEFLQWLHFAESTAFTPIGTVVWLTVYRDDAAAHSELVEDAANRARKTLQYVGDCLGGKDYLLGSDFTAADVMMGFTLAAADSLGLLSAEPNLQDYLKRLEQRPGLKNANEKLAEANC